MYSFRTWLKEIISEMMDTHDHWLSGLCIIFIKSLIDQDLMQQGTMG